MEKKQQMQQKQKVLYDFFCKSCGIIQKHEIFEVSKTKGAKIRCEVCRCVKERWVNINILVKKTLLNQSLADFGVL